MAGLARARAEGTRLGRRPSVTADAVRAIRAGRAAGATLRMLVTRPFSAGAMP
jgi:hypothetical protein